MHYLVSVLLLAFLPFATGEKCKTNGGQCDQMCIGDTVPGQVNDCPGTQYCCVKKNAPGERITPAAVGTTAPGKVSAQKKYFTEKILVCSPLEHKYVRSNTETLMCNANHTSLLLLYKHGFRLIRIVDDGKKAIYYLDKR